MPLIRWLGKTSECYSIGMTSQLFSSPNYTVMIFSFKYRVYFEDSALTEHPGAETEMMTRGIGTRAFGISDKG